MVANKHKLKRKISPDRKKIEASEQSDSKVENQSLLSKSRNGNHSDEEAEDIEIGIDEGLDQEDDSDDSETEGEGSDDSGTVYSEDSSAEDDDGEEGEEVDDDEDNDDEEEEEEEEEVFNESDNDSVLIFSSDEEISADDEDDDGANSHPSNGKEILKRKEVNKSSKGKSGTNLDTTTTSIEKMKLKSPSAKDEKLPNKLKKANRKSSSRPKSHNTVKKEKDSSEDVQSNASSLKTIEKDEYASGDTSDEEDIRNTIGNIPVNWYDDYKHIGYDWEGKKIIKPDHGDHLDYFLRRMEDPNFWRTVRDPKTGQDVVLSDKDVQLIQRLESQKIPDEAYDEYAPWIEWFTSEVMKMPLRKFPESKKSFIPSLDEKKKVAKMVHALKMGWMKSSKQLRKEKQMKEEGPQFYMLWQSDDIAEEMRRIHRHIPAPKRPLPGHAESYNPPEEYLFTEKELQKFEDSKRSAGNKKLHFIPKKYECLRKVPAYDRYLIERFNRCLDLYLCPRATKIKLTVEPEDLLPKLPSPRDLQPFPTMQALVFEGHTDMVRTISLDPLGQYVVSGSDDSTVKFWELSTGRCLKTIPVEGVVRCVRWCPNQTLSLVAVAADNKCYIINPGLGDSLVVSKTDTLLQERPPEVGIIPDRVKACAQWHWASENKEDVWPDGVLIVIDHFKEIKQVAWHGKGDYFAAVMPDGANRSVVIHQLSKGRSQLPFNKSRGLIQCVIFHPIRPFFFVASQKNVRVYDLVKQEMVKKLYSNCKWISNMAIHPGGDNLLLSSYDSKVVWFDLDLSTKPYKVLRLHSTAVRSVAYHKRYPLFASVADDCSLIVSHGMVYNDLMQNALIVPLKRLSSHKNHNDFGIFEVMFHHSQPWVLTCGADKTIRLYS